MRTVDFSRVFFDSLQFSGNDRQNIQPETFSQFRDFISYRLREIWESFDWADICRLQNFTSTTSNEVTYFTPVSSADEIIGVFSVNPQTTTRSVDLDYHIYNDNGTEKVVLPNKIAEGWYAYRLKCPELNGDLYNSSISYSLGAQIYFDHGSDTGTYVPVAGKPHYGNFYVCVSPTTSGQSPSSTPTKWQKVEIPYIFGSPLAWGSTANWFMSEGMAQEAAVVEQKYQLALEQEYDKETRQQGQYSRITMIQTY